ncbi:MAG: DNA replication/repair protein RecF [Nannocystaceae bacterium]
MRLTRLELRAFRNLGDVSLDFGPGLTVLFGHNGAGKTNILESLYFVSTLRSFRCSELGPLVMRDEAQASVSVVGRDLELDLDSNLYVQITKGSRSTRRLAQADGKTVRSAADFYGRLRTIVFTPEDLGVLRGSPGERRRFLDRAIFARERIHISDIQAYEKLVRSRNHVLRDEVTTRPASRTQLLDTYEQGLAEVGARIWTRRTEFIAAITPGFKTTYAKITGGKIPATVGYRSAFGDVPPDARQAALAKSLRDHRPEDFRRGRTTVGPHRDDLDVRLDGQPASNFASQGQSRALMLALKLAELQISESSTGEAPILLLDDVSSELDPQRSRQLFAALQGVVHQCIVTTTAPDFIPLPATWAARHYEVADGAVRKVAIELKPD